MTPSGEVPARGPVAPFFPATPPATNFLLNAPPAAAGAAPDANPLKGIVRLFGDFGVNPDHLLARAPVRAG